MTASPPLRFSIVTPSFNQGAYIERTIRSVLEQNYEHIEYIVIDGGSTDKSVDVIRRYADRLAYWVSEPDRGQTDAINKGLARATGDVVAYINSDDWYLPDAFARAAQVLTAYPDGGSVGQWVCGAAGHVYANGDAGSEWFPEPPPEVHEMLVQPWGIPQVACFWRRSLFERFGSFREDMHFAFDTEFQIRLVLEGCAPLLLRDRLGMRLLHDDCKTVAKPEGFRREQAQILDLHAGRLTSEQLRRARRLARWRDAWLALRDRHYASGSFGLSRLLLTSPLWTMRNLVGALQRRARRRTR